VLYLCIPICCLVFKHDEDKQEHFKAINLVTQQVGVAFAVDLSFRVETFESPTRNLKLISLITCSKLIPVVRPKC